MVALAWAWTLKEWRRAKRQAGLEAAQGFEPVVLVAAGCFEASKELGLTMPLPEAVQQPVEPVMALEGVVELEDRFNDSFLLIKQDEVGIALTDVDAEEVARHSLGGWLSVQACGQIESVLYMRCRGTEVVPCTRLFPDFGAGRREELRDGLVAQDRHLLTD